MAGGFEVHRFVTVLIIMVALIGLLNGGAGFMPGLHGSIFSRASPGITGLTLDASSMIADTQAPAAFPAYYGVDIGFHKSITGTSPDGSPEYWYHQGKAASDKFDGSGTGAVWVIGCAQADGQCYLNFPSSAKYPMISFSKKDDNEQYLDYFDSKGMKVILQVEPGQADVGQVIRLVLDRYADHPCVAGIGIDVEWLQFKDYPEGRQVTDEEAAGWHDLAASYNRDYKLALTHWVADKMPPTYRTGIYFLYDGHGFTSLDDMIGKCASWGRRFHDNPVGFYIGFSTDRAWWGSYEDPFYTIGHALLEKIKNTKGIYWFNGGPPVEETSTPGTSGPQYNWPFS